MIALYLGTLAEDVNKERDDKARYGTQAAGEVRSDHRVFAPTAVHARDP